MQARLVKHIKQNAENKRNLIKLVKVPGHYFLPMKFNDGRGNNQKVYTGSLANQMLEVDQVKVHHVFGMERQTLKCTFETLFTDAVGERRRFKHKIDKSGTSAKKGDSFGGGVRANTFA